MRDQADELRQLVLRSATGARISESPPPPLVVFYGGKGGVGATTLALNAAVSLARLGRRVVLVDAVFNQPDATHLCGLREGDSVADVLAGRRTVHEVLQQGPAGIQVVPGAWAPQRLTDCTPLAQQRLLAELSRLGPHADAVVLDVGCQPGALARRFWEAACQVVVVTTDESSSVMDAYASIKLLATGEPPRELHAVVNKSASESLSTDTLGRLVEACRRFLGFELRTGPVLPLAAEIAAAADARRPFVTTDARLVATERLEQFADALAASWRSEPVQQAA